MRHLRNADDDESFVGAHEPLPERLMRDHTADYVDNADDDELTVEPSRRGGFDALRTLAFLGAVALIAAPAIKSASRRWRLSHPLARTEHAIDKSLKDTFPASDPPATRYFDIPENRQ